MVLYTILAKGTRWDKEEYLESETLVEEAMECEQIQSFLNDTALQEEILRLPEREMQVLKEFYFKNQFSIMFLNALFFHRKTSANFHNIIESASESL